MITVIVPALNEERNLRKTVCDIMDAGAECGNLDLDIIIVNDGSSDGTSEVIKTLEKEFPCVRGLHNEKNIGVGESVKKVLPIAKGEKFILVAGDNDMPQRLMVEIFKNHNKADMIMSYFINKENRRVARNILSMMFQMIYMTTFYIFVQYINGPVLYPTALVRKLKLKSKRFSIAPEMTIKCLRSGCSYYEIAGYMQTGLEGSSALGVKNLTEVVLTYLRLFIEIHFTNKAEFAHHPKRVYY